MSRLRPRFHSWRSRFRDYGVSCDSMATLTGLRASPTAITLSRARAPAGRAPEQLHCPSVGDVAEKAARVRGHVEMSADLALASESNFRFRS